MLKIKDEVDLKELEKFGLIKKIGKFQTYYYEPKEDMISIDAFERLIHLYTDDYSGVNILFDLIQAGLVEKVEE